MMQVNVKATWSYPTWGHLETGHSGMAVAFICDDCYERGHEAGRGEIIPVRCVVEFGADDTIIYHERAERDGRDALV